ncbi:hypothetical protein [Enterovibrio norvegicus]|uniref:Uncharacterized protein n=1 Tax=Enterovibrio norvegicus TaxID=188144 RepID=A0A2N7LAK9_9GAMM|nr:hypothetical protein [Enterovibrio norvegicus]PMN91615.1 hypothetical protein BCT23_17110 [Enterovibrio norvegicus]
MTMFGEIDSHCFIEINSNRVVDLSNQDSDSIPFTLDCNQPLTISIWSKSGGLALSNGSHKTTNSYLLSLNISNIGMRKTFNSKELSSVQRMTGSNEIPFKTRGEIRIEREQEFVFSGEYKDVITIDVSPSINGSF